MAAIFVFFPALFLSAGYFLAMIDSANPAHAATAGPEAVASQDVARNALDAVNALTLRIGDLQARVIRLDALGKRLVDMADLDEGEFDFGNAPAQGGPEELLGRDTEATDLKEFLSTLDQLGQQLENREQQLTVLETMMMNRSLQNEVLPAGRPIEKGWVSSHFGKRTDPFTGHPAFHYGVDFAGKAGSNVVSVASGVVTWAGERYGYGRLVEVDHGNGLVTRYGHNKEVLVAVGDTVKKGQIIGLMGSSGRSTGPHVHFEVIKNGKAVNPAKYIHAAR